MKTLLLLLALSFQAKADHPTFNIPEGFKLHPYQVCRSINRTEYYPECIDAITEDNYTVEIAALITCDTLFNPKLVVKCLNIINNNKYDKIALGLCNTYRSAKTTVKCLKSISNYRYNKLLIELCHEHESLDVMSCMKQLKLDIDYNPKPLTPRCVKYRDTNICKKM